MGGFSGQEFGQGFFIGAASSFAGSMFGHGSENVLKTNQTWTTVGTIAFSGATGGIVAELTGGDFWKGAAIGVTIAALNHELHQLLDDGGDPKGKRTEGKGNKFRGGTQKQRDGDLGKIPKEDAKAFREWYHKKGNSESYKLKGQPDPDIMDPYNDWIDLGRPKFSPIGVGVGTGLGAAMIYYGSKALQFLGNRLTMPLLIISQLIPQQTNPYGINQQSRPL